MSFPEIFRENCIRNAILPIVLGEAEHAQGLVLAVLVALEIGCRTGVITRITMVPPTVMVVAAVNVLVDPGLRSSLLLTLGEVVAAVASSVVAGIALALVLFANHRLRAIAAPVLSAWYAVPIFVFYPVIIVIFGIGQQSIVAIAFVFSLGTMVLSTLTALDRIPQPLFKTARLMQISLARRIAFMLLPAALPHLVVGLRLVLAYTLIATIAGESSCPVPSSGMRSRRPTTVSPPRRCTD